MEEDPVYADNPEEGYSNDASDLFVLKFEPHELYNDETAVDMLITFIGTIRQILVMQVQLANRGMDAMKNTKNACSYKSGTTMTWQRNMTYFAKLQKTNKMLCQSVMFKWVKFLETVKSYGGLFVYSPAFLPRPLLRAESQNPQPKKSAEVLRILSPENSFAKPRPLCIFHEIGSSRVI